MRGGWDWDDPYRSYGPKGVKPSAALRKKFVDRQQFVTLQKVKRKPNFYLKKKKSYHKKSLGKGTKLYTDQRITAGQLKGFLKKKRKGRPSKKIVELDVDKMWADLNKLHLTSVYKTSDELKKDVIIYGAYRVYLWNFELWKLQKAAYFQHAKMLQEAAWDPEEVQNMDPAHRLLQGLSLEILQQKVKEKIKNKDIEMHILSMRSFSKPEKKHQQYIAKFNEVAGGLHSKELGIAERDRWWRLFDSNYSKFIKWQNSQYYLTERLTAPENTFYYLWEKAKVPLEEPEWDYRNRANLWESKLDPMDVGKQYNTTDNINEVFSYAELCRAKMYHEYTSEEMKKKNFSKSEYAFRMKILKERHFRETLNHKDSFIALIYEFIWRNTIFRRRKTVFTEVEKQLWEVLRKTPRKSKRIKNRFLKQGHRTAHEIKKDIKTRSKTTFEFQYFPESEKKKKGRWRRTRTFRTFNWSWKVNESYNVFI